MEDKARAALLAFIAWVEGDGFDNPEYDLCFKAMEELARDLGMMDRWRQMQSS